MYYYLAKLGRTNAVPILLTAGSVLGSGTYIFLHATEYGLTLCRDFTAAEVAPRQRFLISEHLKTLIFDVVEATKQDYNTPILPSSYLSSSENKFRWYITSAPDPIGFGTSESSNGSLIGLPIPFNYNQDEQLPENLYKIQRVPRFFKGASNSDGETSSTTDCESCERDNAIVMNIDDPDCMQYLDTIRLSNEAKRFAIASTVYLNDNYRVPGIIAAANLSLATSFALGRSAVEILKLRDKHILQRIPLYMTSCFLFAYTYSVFKVLIDGYYIQKADKKAMSLGDDYRRGAVEYFSKVIERNKLLRKICPDYQSIYNKDGEMRNHPIWPSGIQFKFRLEDAKEHVAKE